MLPCLALLLWSSLAPYTCDNGQRAPDGSDLWRRPQFHFWPTAIESQDISGPIKVYDLWSHKITLLQPLLQVGKAWHVFVDNVPVGCPALMQPVQDKPLEWGHFSSEDLVHWTEHPEAITPNSAVRWKYHRHWSCVSTPQRYCAGSVCYLQHHLEPRDWRF